MRESMRLYGNPLHMEVSASNRHTDKIVMELTYPS